MRVAGVIPHNVHPTTWVAALTVAAVCVAVALYIGEKAGSLSPRQNHHHLLAAAYDQRAISPRPSRARARTSPRRPRANRSAGMKRGSRRAQPAASTSPQAAEPKPDDTIEENGSAAETGRASWYDLETPTASGEALDDGELTAAHRSAPFGTRLRVVNLKNGREVVVRVNDRGPFAKDRIIDLSKAAAMRLGMIADGVADVSVTPVADQLAGNSGAGG